MAHIPRRELDQSQNTRNDDDDSGTDGVVASPEGGGFCCIAERCDDSLTISFFFATIDTISGTWIGTIGLGLGSAIRI
jgi:hypothetical protein